MDPRRKVLQQRELPGMSQKWAAALQGGGPLDGEEVLKGDEVLECFFSVEPHQTDSLTTLQKFEKHRSVTLCNLDLTDGQVPAGLACCRNLIHLDLSANNLTSIPEVTFSLLSLKYLNVGLNSIKVIPTNIKLLKKLEKVNLSHNIISDLSPLNACTSLRMLWIGNNRLSDIPTEIRQLTEVKEVDLSWNKITNITPLVEFTQLLVLKVEHNQLVGLPPELEKLTELKEVDLSYNEIIDITPIVGCTQLQVLKVEHNKLVGLPPELEKLTELKVVDLSSNEITDITPVVRCTQLQVLEVMMNKLVGLPPELEKLTELKKVYLSLNNISDITPIKACRQLQMLRVRGNELMCLPAGFEKLSELKEVDLSCNKITHITPIIGCTQLQVLQLWSNKLVGLPAGLEKLTELKEVDLSYNEITDITPIVGCTQLQVLDVWHNMLVGLPAGLEKLTELKKVNLSRNEIIDITPAMGCLQLKELRVAKNRLSNLPDGICQLKKLTLLDISENSIHQLPLHFDQCEALAVIGWSGNPLKRPPHEVCDDGLEAIFQYFKDLRESECSVRKQQVVLLGETGAGKTSLALTLKDGKSCLTDESDCTHVLQKYIWDVNDDLKLHITDFGGHQVYELAHTFFLCSEVIALLTVDLSHYSNGMYNETVGRWVNSIMFMSPKSTVMVAGTHSDCCTKESAEKAKTDIATQITKQRIQMAECVESQLHNIEGKLKSAIEDGSPEFQSYLRYLTQIQEAKRQQLMSMRSNIVQSEHVFVVSSSSLHGIPELHDALIRSCDRKAITLPSSWLSIQDRMDGEDIKAKLYIQYDEFCDIVHRGLSSSGFPADQSHKTAEALASYQHRSGAFLWFKEDKHLRQCVFHKPEMIVDFLKSIFHHDMETLLDHDKQHFRSSFSKGNFDKEKKNFLQHGTLSPKLLRCLVKRFVTDVSMFETMVHLLEKFFLCFPLCENDDVSRLLFPWFLTNDEPRALKEKKWLTCLSKEHMFQVNFCFPVQCPTGFFERAVVLMHQRFGEFLLDCLSWKDGVFLHKDEDRALFTRQRDGSDVIVTLALRGPDVATLWPRFAEAYSGVVDLLKKWPGVLCDMQYLCPHCLVSGQQTPSWYPAEKLLQSGGKLGKYLPCENCTDNRIDVDVVIPGGVIGPRRESTMLKRRGMDTEDTFPLMKKRAHALRDSEPQCQRGKDTVSGHFMNSLTQAFSSVAKVTWSNGTCGSGFRVGSRYLITNYHVVDETPAPTQEEETRRQNARSCLFNFDRSYQYGDEAGFRSIRLAPNPVVIYDEELDYAVLMLIVDSGNPLPEALTKFTKLGRHEKIHFAGHPDGQAKVVDILCSIVHHPLAGPNKALYHTSEKMIGGSSGSPGLVSDGQDNARVAVVHSGRYHDLVPPGPLTYGIEYGVRMEEVYRHMHDTNECLCNDIFPEGEPQ